MRVVLGLIFVLGIWWLASHLLNLDLILPTPEITVRQLVEELTYPSTLKAILSTFWKGILATVLVLAVGTPVGLVMGLSGKVYDILRPAILIIQSVPVISWLALVIFTWGIGWRGPVFISFLSLFPVVVFNTVSGVRSTDSGLIEMAKVYSVSKAKVLLDVYLGSLVPFVLASLNVIVGGIWKTILVAEYLCGDSGIGVEISWARQFVDVPRVYALTMIGIALGIGFERTVRYAVRRVERRWGLCSDRRA